MIIKIRHRGLRAYYEKEQTKGLNADWLPRIDLILSVLDVAQSQMILAFQHCAYIHSRVIIKATGLYE